MLPTPFGGHEMARVCCDLLDEVSHRVKGGFPDKSAIQDVFHPSSHLIGDGGHRCFDRRHGCAIRAL